MTNAHYALRPQISLTNNSFGTAIFREAANDERRTRLEFHVASDDYFGTLATILGLMADALSKDDARSRERCIRDLSALREDLVYLQHTHVIQPRAAFKNADSSLK